MSDTVFSNILAIDTAGPVFSAALETSNGSTRELWYFEADAGARHSQLVMEVPDMLARKAGIKPEDITLVVCMNGPGSFTGLRIGLSAAKGMALSLSIPFIAISSFDCMAWPYSVWPGLVLPVIDAKKNSYFCSVYQRGERLTGDMDADSEAIFRTLNGIVSGQNETAFPPRALLTGPDAGKLYEELYKNNEISFSIAPFCRSGCARELLAIAKTRKISNNENSDFNCGPEYIRKSDAEQNFIK